MNPFIELLELPFQIVGIVFNAIYLLLTLLIFGPVF